MLRRGEKEEEGMVETGEGGGGSGLGVGPRSGFWESSGVAMEREKIL